jgi:hypothetical protein
MEGLSQGVTTKEVACQLGLSERTVQKWKAAPTFPEVKKRRKKRSDFDAFARLSAQTVAAGRAKWSDPVAGNPATRLHRISADGLSPS